MKRSRTILSLLAVISLSVSVIWHSPAFAATAPGLSALGQIGASQLIPAVIDVDQAGNLYVVDLGEHSVVKLDPYGNVVASFLAGFASGRGLAVSADGRQLYVSGDSAVAIVDPTDLAAPTRYLSPAADVPASELQVPGVIDLDRDGFVFVADFGTMEVKVYNPQGAFQYLFGGVGTAAGQFKSIAGLTVDTLSEPQRLVVADRSQERVQVLSLSGQALSSKSTATGFGSTPLLVPADIVLDQQGRAYFLDSFSSNVRVAASDLTYLSIYAGSELSAVRDLALDVANSRLLVASESGIFAVGVDGGSNPVKRNEPPTAPLAIAPSAGGVVTSLQPQVEFSVATDADGDALVYEVQVLASGLVVADMTDLATTTAVVPVALVENSAYEWQVRAFDGTDYSTWSDAVQFQVNATPEAPGAPVLRSPLSGEALDGTGLLSWSVASDPDPNETALLRYRVVVTADANADQPVLLADVVDSALALGQFGDYANLTPGQGYSWRVATVDPTGLTTDSETTGSFVFQPTVLAVAANMPNAKVFLGGNPGYSGHYVGDAPVALRDLAAGTYAVTVEAPGCEPFMTVATLDVQGQAAVVAQMVPAMQPGDFAAAPFVAGSRVAGVEGDAFPTLVDFNNDGLVDLLAGDAAGVLRLYVGNGDGFDSAVDLGLILPPGAAPAVADWNNDGLMDLLVGTFDGNVRLYLNIGEGNAPRFDSGRDLTLVGGTTLAVVGQAAPAVVDFDGDLDKDLLVGSGSGQLVLFVNNGSDSAPQLAAGVLLQQFSGGVVPCPADWTGDGNRDLLVATADGLVRLGAQEDGTWAVVESLNCGVGLPLGVATLDLDGKGGKDLIVGLADGSLYLAHSGGQELVPAFSGALADKILQVCEAIAESDTQTSRRLSRLAEEVRDGRLPVSKAIDRVVAQLRNRNSCQETTELLQILTLVDSKLQENQGNGRNDGPNSPRGNERKPSEKLAKAQ